MATRGIQEKLSNGTITEIRMGSTADSDKVVKQSQLDLKRDITNRSFGSGVNVSEFDATTGHLEFKGDSTVWEDDNLDPLSMSGQGDAVVVTRIPGTTLDIAGFAWNKTTSVQAIREYPHKGKINKAGETSVVLGFHGHLYPTTADGGDVLMEVEYAISLEGIAIPASTKLTQVVTLGTTAWARNNFFVTDVVVPEVSQFQLHFKFTRLSADVLDTYPDTLAVSTVGYHYEIDGVGSRQRLVK